MTKDSSYIMEFHQHGNSVKVTAMCTETLIEVSVITPKQTSQYYMEKLAINKVEFVKAKQSSPPPKNDKCYDKNY
jgi:uncharacterized protein DUF6898